MAMSRRRHLVASTRPDARNVSAEENASAAKPNCRSRSGSDSRTDSSSSMTDTNARSSIMNSSSGLTLGVAWDGEREGGTWTVVRLAPEVTAMPLYDRAADGESHPHAVCFGGIEGV